MEARRTFVAVLIGIFLLAVGPLPEGAPTWAAEGKPRLAMIFPGPVQDADFNTVGYLALMEVQRQHGIESAYSENVPAADWERVAREYINAGFRIIVFHGGQFVAVVRKLAPLFPDVTFTMQTTSRVPDLPANIWNIGSKTFRGFYPAGVLAALSTKTNKVGYITGLRLPVFIASINNIQQALREYNPQAQLIHTFTGDQNDPIKARQAAEAQIDRGVDFIIIQVNFGTYGVLEAAQAAKTLVLVSGFTTDKSAVAPKVMTTSVLTDYRKPYVEIAGRILKGERGGYHEFRPGTGIDLAPIRLVPSEVAAKTMEAFREVAAGKPLPEIMDRIVSP